MSVNQVESMTKITVRFRPRRLHLSPLLLVAKWARVETKHTAGAYTGGARPAGRVEWCRDLRPRLFVHWLARPVEAPSKKDFDSHTVVAFALRGLAQLGLLAPACPPVGLNEADRECATQLAQPSETDSVPASHTKLADSFPGVRQYAESSHFDPAIGAPVLDELRAHSGWFGQPAPASRAASDEV